MNSHLIKYNSFNYDKNHKKRTLAGNNSVDIEVDKLFFFHRLFNCRALCVVLRYNVDLTRVDFFTRDKFIVDSNLRKRK